MARDRVAVLKVLGGSATGRDCKPPDWLYLIIPKSSILGEGTQNAIYQMRKMDLLTAKYGFCWSRTGFAGTTLAQVL